MASSVSSISDLPLFPLSAVLFPSGQLRLRVFEPRYLDLVRECTQRDAPFGVCLILEGQEAGEPAVPAAVGTLARITDFFTDAGGILGIHAKGQDRFRVERVHMRDNGQLRGDVRCWEPEPETSIPAEFVLLADILHRLVEQAAPHWRDAPQTCYDQASWVGYRLAELLPLDPAERQMLLELRDPVERLAELRDALPRFQRE
ncbi:LON peptidase substrate-binding domain-containing protein [Oleiagrimonas sp. MCCC 1A03011]|uniref:LON peptidase substrate-binding domain-containing protein n=1 Tax=Oleiagrimonas sp. MCCC 1A03011 TaxID=1926883 RepID=UPI000DC58D15|nr:LON peptidase substrate-binding domain-containing protein [Oleiagrimonas sp. MCCC 1A03011]RAP56996.1 peptidase S16 [Oleiagrimonas sp. MCCC 1A03011]